MVTSNKIRLSLFASVFLLLTASLCQAQVNYGFAFGFEGDLNQIPGYATNGGTYAMVSGNNLQRNTTPTFVPDYYQSPDFGWQLQGYARYSSTQANWYDFAESFSTNYLGNGQASWESTYNKTTDPISYPGNGGTPATFGEAFNVNKNFSPTGLPSAPGLGSQFLDIWGSHPSTADPIGFSEQMNLQFTAAEAGNLFLTLAFGGRDQGNTQDGVFNYNSADRVGYYRLIEGNTIIASGSTDNRGLLPQPDEYWVASTNSSVASAASSTVLNNLATAGVTKRNWEYYQLGTADGTGGDAIALVAGHTYQLQIMLPDELNFDIATGTQYFYVPPLVPIPEPSTYGLLGAGALAGLVAFRRRRCTRKNS